MVDTVYEYECGGCGTWYVELICVNKKDRILHRVTKKPVDKACIHCINRTREQAKVANPTAPVAA